MSTTQVIVRGSAAARLARLGAAGALVAGGLVLGGCGGGDTFVTDDATVTVEDGQNGDDGSITIDSSEGSMTITGESGGELPEGWPEQVAVPAGGTVNSSASFGGDEGDAFQASLTYPDAAAADLIAELKSSMTDAGFSMEAEFTAGGQVAANFVGDGMNVTATASDGDDGAVLIIVIAPDS